MSNLRTYQQSIDVIGTMDASNVRVYQQSIDVIGTMADPTLRVSQQNVQVAGTQTGNAHVDRLYIEVLSPYMEFSVFSTLSLSGSASGEMGWISCSASNTLSLNQSGSQTGGSLAASASNSLSLDDDVAVHGSLSYFTNSSLSISQSATGRHIPAQRPGSTLELTHETSYIGPKALSASNTLILSDNGRIIDTYIPWATSDLSFTQVVGLFGDRNLTAENTLWFSQFADTILKIRNVYQELVLTQSAVGEITKFVGNTLELTQVVQKGITWIQITQPLHLEQEATVHSSVIVIGPGKPYPIDVAALELEQTVDVYPYYGRASSTLFLSQDVDYFIPQHASAESELVWSQDEIVDDEFETVWYGLSHSVTVISNSTKGIHHYIQWYQEATCVNEKATSTDLSVTHNLSFNSSASQSTTESVSNSLSLSQTVTAVISNTASNDLTLDDEVTYGFTRALWVLSELELESGFGYITVEAEVCTYDPTIGSGSSAPAPNTLINKPTLVQQDSITLSYPWSSPTTSVVLRAPELGNTNKLEFQRINRKTRGGTLIIWADNQWPKNEKMSISIKGLSETKTQELFTFIEASIGKEIGLTDWEGQTLRAVLMNPETEISRNAICNNAITLEFEITWTALIGLNTNTLELTSVASRALVKGSTGSNTLVMNSFSTGVNT